MYQDLCRSVLTLIAEYSHCYSEKSYPSNVASRFNLDSHSISDFSFLPIDVVSMSNERHEFQIVVQCLVVVRHLLFVPIITFLCVDIYRNYCIIYDPIVLSLPRHLFCHAVYLCLTSTLKCWGKLYPRIRALVLFSLY